LVASLLASNFNCNSVSRQLKLHTMPTRNLRITPDAEKRLRTAIAREFRRVAAGYGSEQAAARAIGISRQRFKQYLDKKMTPKADVLLVAMANWSLKIPYEGVTFSARSSSTRVKPQLPEQLTLDYFDEPQILHDGQRYVEVRVSRKQADTLKLAMEIRLAG
jgi:hypothetical protein